MNVGTEKDSDRLTLVVDLATRDAKEGVAMQLAADKARLAKTGGLNRNSRRWVGLALRLKEAARAYIDSLADEILKLPNHKDNPSAYSDAVESFITHLDQVYAKEWELNAPWRRDRAAPPPAHWIEMQSHLALAVEAKTAAIGHTADQHESVDRAPSVKGGRGPDDKEILVKADEMKARGLDGRTIAKQMRFEPGFKHVQSTEVRKLILGRYKPSGRPKKSD